MLPPTRLQGLKIPAPGNCQPRPPIHANSNSHAGWGVLRIGGCELGSVCGQFERRIQYWSPIRRQAARVLAIMSAPRAGETGAANGLSFFFFWGGGPAARCGAPAEQLARPCPRRRTLQQFPAKKTSSQAPARGDQDSAAREAPGPQWGSPQALRSRITSRVFMLFGNVRKKKKLGTIGVLEKNTMNFTGC